jgi:hypothetical protein
MANQTLQEDYTALASTHWLYERNRDRWQFLYESYVGGEEYRRSGHLTRYSLETDGEYNRRLQITALDNHCQSVIQTYISFLFREEPEREFESWTGYQDVESFLRDATLDGMDFDTFMKQVSIWSSVFGHSWVVMTKPNMGLITQAQEQELDVRPYVNLVTPLVVSDWRWQRMPNGRYELGYFKYVEEVIDKITVIKVWTRETIETWQMDDVQKTAVQVSVEPNMLGRIPAVLVYNQKSVTKDIGVSDITDIADLQRQIYNLNSENEQSIRMDGHPSLVVPPNCQLGAGAGAIIQLQEGSDPGLNPYYLEHGTSGVSNIHSSMDKLIEAIDRISFTGGVRATAQRTMSGIAMETEFQLLNAKLSEKADMMELAEEQIWRLFGIYQGREWDGEIDYPSSFNIRDTQREFSQLYTAKTAATDPRVLTLIDHEIVELLGEDPTLVLTTSEYLPPEQLPPAEPFEPHTMINPETGEEVIARTEAEHIAYMEQGYVHEGDEYS